jgi:hypothetical protein
VDAVLCDGFNPTVSSPSDRRGSEARICIVAIKDKTTGFIHIAWIYFVYIMSSYFMHYSVCHELNTQRGKHISALEVE